MNSRFLTKPPAKTSKSRAKAHVESYSPTKPADSETVTASNKENDSPNDSSSPANDIAKASQPAEKTTKKKDACTKASDDLPDSYLGIVLEENKGEVPCYRNVRALLLFIFSN